MEDPEDDEPVLEGGIWGGWKMSISEASAKRGTAEAVSWGRFFFGHSSWHHHAPD